MERIKTLMQSMTLDSTPPHYGKQYAGQTLEWLSTDTEKNYQTHCKRSDYCEYIKNKGWDQPGAITYRINSLGYRGDEFDPDKPCLLALGCSFSAGIGLPEQDVWPWQLGQYLNLPVINLSWPGYSADTCFRLAEFFLPRLNVELCVMLAPPVARIELVGPNLAPGVDFEVFMPEGMSDRYNANDAYLNQWMIYEENSRLNTVKNKLALEMLCYKHQVPCLTYDYSQYFGRSREEVEYARDYMHAGPRGHTMLTENIIKDYEQAFRKRTG
jgi:hypothetical protein